MSCLAALLLVLIPPPPAGAGNECWNALDLKPGVKVVVVAADGNIRKGRTAEWTTEAVTLRTTAGLVSIARDDVAILRAAGPAGDFHTVYAPWKNVCQIPAGQRIRIIRTNLSQIDGAIEEATGSGLTLAREGARLLVPRNRIRKVRVLIKSNTEQAATVGATIGFLAALAAAVAASTQGGVIDGDIGGVLDTVALGTGTLAGGVASLFDQYQTVYVSPRK